MPPKLSKPEPFCPLAPQAGKGQKNFCQKMAEFDSLRTKLYAITPDFPWSWDTLKTVLDAGIALLQYRDKTSNLKNKIKKAEKIKKLCEPYNIPLIINDDIRVAQAVNAAGIHIGKNDASLKMVQENFPEAQYRGVSCYHDLERAITAQTQGATYVAFGCFFPSQTKPSATRAPLTLLQQAKATLHCPIVAIGGINAQTVPHILPYQPDFLALSQALFSKQERILFMKAFEKDCSVLALKVLPR